MGQPGLELGQADEARLDHLTVAERERPVVDEPVDTPDEADRVVVEPALAERLQRIGAHGHPDLLGHLAKGRRLVALAGRHDATDRQVPPAGPDVLGLAPPVDQHLATAGADQHEHGPVPQVGRPHHGTGHGVDDLVVVVHDVDELALMSRASTAERSRRSRCANHFSASRCRERRELGMVGHEPPDGLGVDLRVLPQRPADRPCGRRTRDRSARLAHISNRNGSSVCSLKPSWTMIELRTSQRSGPAFQPRSAAFSAGSPSTSTPSGRRSESTVSHHAFVVSSRSQAGDRRRPEDAGRGGRRWRTPRTGTRARLAPTDASAASSTSAASTGRGRPAQGLALQGGALRREAGRGTGTGRACSAAMATARSGRRAGTKAPSIRATTSGPRVTTAAAPASGRASGSCRPGCGAAARTGTRCGSAP